MDTHKNNFSATLCDLCASAVKENLKAVPATNPEIFKNIFMNVGISQ